ncbi:putative NADP(+)-dependent dehydrogenase [Cadophora sp. MPI-SDFR-AT-0126]|nr:putative NADP(+)-dependent dehydrogenase [Leotiomycetes sp. MPI-SDFR-AT-0126]
MSTKMAGRDPKALALSGALFTKLHQSKTYDYISPSKLDLSGKHVLVTGAAWEDGVGYATATAFARAGASAIAIADLHPLSDDLVLKLKLAATQAGRAEPIVLSFTVDIAAQDNVQAMHDTVSQSFGGRLDVVVNNAAHMEPYKTFLDSDPDVYWRTWEVNIRGLFNMARAFLPMLLASRDATNNAGPSLCTMINVSSSGALSARPTSCSYRSSKLAILRWTETLQLEDGEKGLLTFCVNPGAIKTKITENMLPEKVRDSLPDQPSVAGDTIVWLAAERREWLGGRYVSCPWDMEELMKKKDEIIKNDLLKLRMEF